MDIFDKILLGLFLFFVVIISFSTFVYYKVSQKNLIMFLQDIQI